MFGLFGTTVNSRAIVWPSLVPRKPLSVYLCVIFEMPSKPASNLKHCRYALTKNRTQSRGRILSKPLSRAFSMDNTDWVRDWASDLRGMGIYLIAFRDYKLKRYFPKYMLSKREIKISPKRTVHCFNSSPMTDGTVLNYFKRVSACSNNCN